MKKFKIVECEYSGKLIKKVIFEDKSWHDRVVKIHDKYGEYFEVDNNIPNDGTKDEPDPFKLFTDRIKDAYETVKNGDGDCIVHSTGHLSFMSSEEVIYFLDRKVGEELRQKTLDTFANAEFVYAVKGGYKNSFSPSQYISRNLNFVFISMGLELVYDIATFSTPKEAIDFINSAISTAKKYTRETTDASTTLAEMRNKFGPNSIIRLMVREFLRNPEVLDDTTKSEFYLEIVQFIKPKDKKEEA